MTTFLNLSTVQCKHRTTVTGNSDLASNDVMPIWRRKEEKKGMPVTGVKDGRVKETKGYCTFLLKQ
jgi:hypothetical protein